MVGLCGSSTPSRASAFFRASRELDAQLERALLAFDTQLAGQQAIVDHLGVLSRRVRPFFEPRVEEGLAITEACGFGFTRRRDGGGLGGTGFSLSHRSAAWAWGAAF